MSGSQNQPWTPVWNTPAWTRNMLRPAPIQQIPLQGRVPQAAVPPGPLPGAQLFAGLTPMQAFWLQHLMGQNVGMPGAASQINPWLMMQLAQGPQTAIPEGGQNAGLMAEAVQQ